jgi:spermidine/putrescine transport system permease protein
MRRSRALTNKKNIWLSGPYLLWIIGFILLPLVTIFYYGFTSADGAVTLDNIVGAVTDPNNIKVFGKTMLVSVLATVICLLLSYPLALCLSKLDMKKSSVLIFLFILPMWMNFMLQMVAINLILEDNGIINALLSSLGFEKIHIANTFTAILIGMVYDYFPFMLLPVYNTVSRIDKDLLNASRDLGAGSVRTFFRITLPLSLPGIRSGVTMVFVPAISDFAIAEMLGGGNIWLIGNVIENNFVKGQYHSGSGLALILMVFVVGTSLLMGGDSESEGGAMLP